MIDVFEKWTLVSPSSRCLASGSQGRCKPSSLANKTLDMSLKLGKMSLFLFALEGMPPLPPHQMTFGTWLETFNEP